MHKRNHPLPFQLILLLHLCALGLALVLYALPHHVIAQRGESLDITSSRETAVTAPSPTEFSTPVPTSVPVPDSTPEPDPDLTATPLPLPSDIAASISEAEEETVPLTQPADTPAPTAEAAPIGDFSAKFADKFSKNGVQADGNHYVSKNLNITISSRVFEGATCHLADIYISDIECLITAFAKDTYGRGISESGASFAKRFNSIVGINGDYYGTYGNGIVVRNGTLYRNEKNVRDVCAIYWDGTMKCFSPKNFNAKAEMKNGLYQAWCFGPSLLDSKGRSKTDFNSSTTKKNPRTVLGYYEPGHYCFLTVEGRNEDSDGLDMKTLSKLMEKLGCTAAYNMDGGRSSALTQMTNYVNACSGKRRDTSDFIMIIDGPRKAG